MTTAAPPEKMMLDALRADGWAVAVHNDYRMNGEAHTFWLFTKGDHCVKGEGQTDAEALAICREAARRLAPRVGGDAVAFIRVLTEEFVTAGYPAGDREVLLANVRSALSAPPAASAGEMEELAELLWWDTIKDTRASIWPDHCDAPEIYRENAAAVLAAGYRKREGVGEFRDSILAIATCTVMEGDEAEGPPDWQATVAMIRREARAILSALPKWPRA